MPLISMTDVNVCVTITKQHGVSIATGLPETDKYVTQIGVIQTKLYLQLTII